MNKLPFSFLGAMAFGIATSHATLYSLTGSIDPLQSGLNGGFGSFDGGIAGAGNGSGSISGTYDDVSNLLDYTISWENLSAAVTNMHFHVAPPGANGGVVLGVPGPWSSPETDTDVLLSASDESSLLAGNWYVNIHTANFPGGEIRGQVNVTPVPEPGATTLALSAAGLLLLRRRRS